jgi:hypothetical protein
VHLYIVQNHMNRGNARRDALVQAFQKGNHLHLSLSGAGLAPDPPRPSVEGGKQVQGAVPTVFVLNARRSTRAGRKRPYLSWPRLEARLLVHRQNHLVVSQGSGVQGFQFPDPILRPRLFEPWATATSDTAKAAADDGAISCVSFPGRCWRPRCPAPTVVRSPCSPTTTETAPKRPGVHTPS